MKTRCVTGDCVYRIKGQPLEFIRVNQPPGNGTVFTSYKTDFISTIHMWRYRMVCVDDKCAPIAYYIQVWTADSVRLLYAKAIVGLGCLQYERCGCMR
jgi:hypothetical protein